MVSLFEISWRAPQSYGFFRRISEKFVAANPSENSDVAFLIELE